MYKPPVVRHDQQAARFQVQPADGVPLRTVLAGDVLRKVVEDSQTRQLLDWQILVVDMRRNTAGRLMKENCSGPM